MAAIVGAAGLAPTLAAARAGKKILLANKEALVMAGAVFMARGARGGRDPAADRQRAQRDLPVPSAGVARGPRRGRRPPDPADRLGRPVPRRGRSRSWRRSRRTQACAHPTWDMGRKISVDSATMMNKALEIIEAAWLFGASPDAIEVVVHPQSVIHSMVDLRRRLGDRAARQPRHAHADRLRAGVSGAHRRRRRRPRPRAHRRARPSRHRTSCASRALRSPMRCSPPAARRRRSSTRRTRSP